MKNLITTVASMIIIMSFICQIIANEKTFIRLYAGDAIIESNITAWNEAGEITEGDIHRLSSEIDEKLQGKVKVNSVKKSPSKEGFYDISLSYLDVIGPVSIVGYRGENKADRVKQIYVAPKKEEIPPEDPGTEEGNENTESLEKTEVTE